MSAFSDSPAAPRSPRSAFPRDGDSSVDAGARTAPSGQRKPAVGRLFRRGKRGIWWTAVYRFGREVRTSTHTIDESLARHQLALRVAEVETAKKLTGGSESRVTFNDLWSLLVDDYAVNRRRSAKSLPCRLANLAPFFLNRRAVDITSESIRRYAKARLAEKAAPATVNRELAGLRRGFRLAQRLGILTQIPFIELIAENNIRQGFVEPDDFLTLVAALPDYLKDPIRFLYLSGWRSNEMKSLEWRDVGRSTGTITLRRERSKNRDPRILPIIGELREIIERAWSARIVGCPLVFHREGKPLGEFARRAWKRACSASGMRGLIVHDLRRSAGRNLTQAGVSEGVVMAIMGHKTRSMFARYRIVRD